jgi:hypothetical protein
MKPLCFAERICEVFIYEPLKISPLCAYLKNIQLAATISHLSA